MSYCLSVRIDSPGIDRYWESDPTLEKEAMYAEYIDMSNPEAVRDPHSLGTGLLWIELRLGVSTG
jgi:hypothetical protein